MCITFLCVPLQYQNKQTMKRIAKISKNLNTPKDLINSKLKEIERLKFEIAYFEMREATGTLNKFSIQDLVDRNAKYEEEYRKNMK